MNRPNKVDIALDQLALSSARSQCHKDFLTVYNYILQLEAFAQDMIDANNREIDDGR